MSIRVAVNGAFGKMGRVTTEAILAEDDFDLVGSFGRDDDLASCLRETQPEVVIDFTLPHVVFNNAQLILSHGARPVIGTSGLTPAQMEQLAQQCEALKLGGIIAPNFSLGAILMMCYAKDAAKYFKHAEIIELHHEKKVDAPSGTAMKTAHLMAEANSDWQNPYPNDAARGDNQSGIQIHSVRLPGLFAHQVVIFGSAGETLSLRHDAQSREAMMPGVCLATRAVMGLNHLVYGLEQVMGFVE